MTKETKKDLAKTVITVLAISGSNLIVQDLLRILPLVRRRGLFSNICIGVCGLVVGVGLSKKMEEWTDDLIESVDVLIDVVDHVKKVVCDGKVEGEAESN